MHRVQFPAPRPMSNLALAHFKKVDPVLYDLALKVKNLPEIIPANPKDYFKELCDSIVSQQLSIKAASTIWNRVTELFPDRKITPDFVLQITEEQFRRAGMSFAKIKYIKDLASRDLNFSDFPTLSDSEIAKRLIEVKGIGPWTAEMFLLFSMGRPDVFSYGDLGLRNAMKKLPDLKDPVDWSPYRSYASRILWKSLE